MTHREATADDLDLLAGWNHQLIEDESADNPMTVPELRERMAEWLDSKAYRAIIFSDNSQDLAYALFAESDTEIWLRQFFVDRNHRRQSHGRESMKILRSEIWPQDKRLTVEVLAHNTDAYSFWRETGYHACSIRLEIEANRKTGAKSDTSDQSDSS